MKACNKKRLLWIMSALLFLAACLMPWFGRGHGMPVAITTLMDPAPAGEITRDMHIAEAVALSPSQVRLHRAEAYCIGLLFATYKRVNEGVLSIELAQAGKQTRRSIPMRDLADNEALYICPDFALDPGSRFSISIDGRDGEAGSSATVWLTSDTRAGTATVADMPVARGLQLTLMPTSMMSGLGLSDRGTWAFIACSFSTLFMGLAVLAWSFSASGSYVSHRDS